MARSPFWVGAVAAGLVLMPAATAFAQAAHYELIRVDAGLAGGYASGIEAGGFGGVIEPKFLIMDNLAVGVRVEGLVVFGANIHNGNDDASIGSGSASSFLAKAEYLVGNFAV